MKTDMYNHCAGVFRLTIPAVRIATAKALSKEYSMSQSEIARNLGIAQPAVNKYLNGRYTGKVKTLEALIERKGLVRGVTRLAAAGSATSGRISAKIDELASSEALVKAAMKLL